MATHYPMPHLPEPVATALVTVVPQLHRLSNTIPPFLDIAVPSGPTFRAQDCTLRVTWSGYVHHSARTVAAAIGGLVDPDFARTMTGEGWGMRLVPAVATVPKMDTGERAVLAALGGILIPLADADSRTYSPWFAEALFGLIERRKLTEFFDIEPGRLRDRYAVQPRLDDLTKRARGLSLADRAILSIIVGLYRGDGWPEGFKRDWNPSAANAFDRVNTLWPTAPEDVRDVYTLLATYPGW